MMSEIMSFNEQARILSDIKNLRRARRELFSSKIYLLCCAYIFFIVFIFYSSIYFYKDRIEISFLFLIMIPLSLLALISVLEKLEVSAKNLLSHNSISLLSISTSNELKNFISSKLLKNKVLFIKKNELDSFILDMENRYSKIKEREYIDEFKNKVNDILNDK